MNRKTPFQLILLAGMALAVSGSALSPLSAHADGDKGKDGKGPVVIIGKPIITPDPPKKK